MTLAFASGIVVHTNIGSLKNLSESTELVIKYLYDEYTQKKLKLPL